MRGFILFLISVSNPAWSACYMGFWDSAQDIALTLPETINKPTNSQPGTILWDSGWKRNGTINKITCNNTGEYTMGYLTSGINNRGLAAGFADVFNTTIPGVGIRVYTCNNSSCSSPPAGPNEGKAITGTFGNKTHFIKNIGRGPFYSVVPQFWVQLVATTGSIGNGTLNYAGGKLASVTYGPMEVGHLYINGLSSLNGTGCLVNPESKSIKVELPKITTSELQKSGDSVPLLSKTFNINLQCDKGVYVHYKIRGLTSDNDTLKNSTGRGMATGVGIKIFQGDDSSSTALPLDTFIQYNSQETPGQNYAVSIPLTARYSRTTANLNEISAGRVIIGATFVMSYQ